jgi:hypothetical protein
MSSTAPLWIAAIATVVLAIGVIVTAWFARAASATLSRQLAAHHELTTQLADTLLLAAKHLGQSFDERRRAQACRVFIDLDRAASGAAAPDDQKPWRVTATIRNTSDQPVYDMYVIWQLGTVRMGKPDPVARLLPGELAAFERSSPVTEGDTPSDPAVLSAFVTFRDMAGVRWTVREDGTLSDIAPTSPHT